VLLTDFDKSVGLALDSLLAERLAIFAGAGLSMAPPSNLPSAWTLAQKAKQKYAAQYGGARPPLSDNIEEQAEYFFQRGELPTVYLATLIDRNAFAGRPNEGHYAIADLMLSRALQTVVTTNVDTLVESAGVYLFGQVEVGIDGHAVAALPPTAIPMLKLHGCRTIDLANTIWAAGQLARPPVQSRIACSTPWLAHRLLNRDLVIVGYWTDWDYLNAVLATSLNAVNPSRVIVVDPADSDSFPEKAPALYALGMRANGGFLHVRESGARFLASLRREFSKSFIRQVLHGGAADFHHYKGMPPDPGWLEAPDLENDQLWLMRRDLLGCEPNAPADAPRPPNGPLVGLTVIELRAAGAVAEGANWRLGEKTIRVLRTPNQVLDRVEATFAKDVAPVVAPDIVVAVGAESRALPISFARGGVTASIARGSGSKWMTHSDAVKELGL
jgi:Sir2 family